MREPRQILTLSLAITALALTVASPASAATNDYVATAATLQTAQATTANNDGASIEAIDLGDDFDEPMTKASGSVPEACGSHYLMTSTLWWTFAGREERSTITSYGSEVDTTVAVYDGDPSAGGELLACSEDADGSFSWGEVRLPPTTGKTLYVQVGSQCDDDPPFCELLEDDPPLTGNITLGGYEAPFNDARADAIDITDGPGSVSNRGATEEAGEPLSCQLPDTDGPSNYGKTVWFSYTADSPGTIKVTTTETSGFWPITAVYRAGTAAPVGCNEFSTPTIAYADQATTYFIQVGGMQFSGAGPGTAADGGEFAVTATFTADHDMDDDHYDGTPSGPDCNDHNGAVHPNAPELANNGVDDDCDGYKFEDADGDGVANEKDCRPNDGAVAPGKAEIPGNDVDEDCSGSDTARRVEAPKIDLDTAKYKRGLFFEWLKIDSLLPGDQVVVRCRGSRACPKTLKRTAKSTRLRLRLFWHRYIARGRVEVLITRPGRNIYGYYWRQTINGRHEYLIRHCLLEPHGTKRTSCGKGA